MTTIHDNGVYYALNDDEDEIEHSMSYPLSNPTPQLSREKDNYPAEYVTGYNYIITSKVL